MSGPGRVVLVGAGPGAPDLITVRGQQRLAEADVVVYDALVDPALLCNAKRGAELIYVGKRGGRPSWRQSEILELLLQKTREAQLVVRLKGGDPLLFARGGEEAEFLAERGIPVEIVPGVTAASGAAADGGFPLTHRGLASQLALVTGHEDPSKRSSDIDWSLLGRWPGTLVFYMGRHTWPQIADNLVQEGHPAETPVAAVVNATLPHRQIVKGSLGAPEELLAQLASDGPTLFVVGEVTRLNFYRNQAAFPLAGRRILITRTARLNSRLGQKLSTLGAEVVSFPTIEIRPPSDPEPLRRAVRSLAQVDGILFTSVHGVEHFFDALNAEGLDGRALAGKKVVAIGKATAAELLRHGIRADWVPKGGTSAAIVDEWPADWDVKGKVLLLPRSSLADDSLPRALEGRLGATAWQVTAYETVRAQVPEEAVNRLVQSPPPDAIVFTSASTVRFFCEMIDRNWFAGRSCVVCIGPVTAAEAEKQGLQVDLMPAEPNAESLVASLASFYQTQSAANVGQAVSTF